VKTTDGFIRGMFTKRTRGRSKRVIQENLKFPREYAARLLFDHATNDWRDLIQQSTSQLWLWVAKRASSLGSLRSGSGNNQGPKTEIFEENEGGAHFMFMENPEKFNRLVSEFNADAVGLRSSCHNRLPDQPAGAQRSLKEAIAERLPWSRWRRPRRADRPVGAYHTRPTNRTIA